MFFSDLVNGGVAEAELSLPILEFRDLESSNLWVSQQICAWMIEDGNKQFGTMLEPIMWEAISF